VLETCHKEAKIHRFHVKTRTSAQQSDFSKKAGKSHYFTFFGCQNHSYCKANARQPAIAFPEKIL